MHHSYSYSSQSHNRNNPFENRNCCNFNRFPKARRLETLKKRKRGMFRAVPLPPDLITMLDLVHNIRRMQRRKDRGKGVRLWEWSAVTAWRKVKAVMDAAGIQGYHASPKGLRHGFGVAAVQASIPLNLVQRWLGHAQLTTTAIYADAVGEEERGIAARLWT